MFAAITLVIGGVPTVAAADACNPCPPDCEMMQAAMADHHGKAPAQQQDQGEAPCKASIACQASAAVLVAPPATTVTWLASGGTGHAIEADLRAPSRPPDRALRPPIQS
jgi:hypothetical protein